MDSQKQNNNFAPNTESVGVGLPPELPSHEQNKENLIDTLHKDGLLPNLRTYHGDIAEFIKSKDQSLSSIALKEHEKKRETEVDKKEVTKKPEENKTIVTGVKKDRNFTEIPTNLLIYIIGGILIFGAGATIVYLIAIKDIQNPITISEDKSIISYSNNLIIDSASISNDLIKETFETLKKNNKALGSVTNISISDSKKKETIKVSDFLDGVDIKIPSSLLRNLSDNFMLGFYDQKTDPNFFLILKVKDYGIAFRDMLNWESTMYKGFESFVTKNDSDLNDYRFVDLIVRNKDTRALASPTRNVRIIYTFLDKETILITESENAVKDILDSYVSANTVR